MRSFLTFFLAVTCATAPCQAFAEDVPVKTIGEPPLNYQLEQHQYFQRVEFLIRQNLMLKSVQMENPEAIVSLRFAA